MPVNNTKVVLINGETAIVDNALVLGTVIISLHLTDGRSIQLDDIREVVKT